VDGSPLSIVLDHPALVAQSRTRPSSSTDRHFISSSMSTDLAAIDTASLKARVGELRRYL